MCIFKKGKIFQEIDVRSRKPKRLEKDEDLDNLDLLVEMSNCSCHSVLAHKARVGSS